MGSQKDEQKNQQQITSGEYPSGGNIAMSAAPHALKAMKKLNENGFEAYLVGGCVRDLLMKQSPKDYDITTDALPEDIIRIFGGHTVNRMGERFGTVRVLIDKNEVDITVFRADMPYEDFRHPSGIAVLSELSGDLSRRDFTINAMAWNPEKNLIDLFGGCSDLACGIVRAVGDANERFREDALRILRAVRFAARFGFVIDEKTSDAMAAHSQALRKISGERIKVELDFILTSPHAIDLLRGQKNILFAVIPELKASDRFDQKNPHHIYDVFEHTLKVMENLPEDICLRWAGLFHDMGKPGSFTLDSRGIGHFKGHAMVSLQLAGAVMDRLRFDNKTRKTIQILVRYHDEKIPPDRYAIRKRLNVIGPENLRLLMRLKRADNLAQNYMRYSRKAEYDEVDALIEDVLADGDCYTLGQLNISGREVTDRGVQGKEVGQYLEKILDAVMRGQVKNEPEALMRLLSKLIDDGLAENENG